MTNEELIAYAERIRSKKCKMVNRCNRMTNKEAYEFIQTLFLPREVMEICLKALEKADKYRWHDLRENPDDLPEAIGGSYVSEYVFVMIGTPGWNNCEWAYYKHNHKEWSTYEQNIIAWRYIEPFEEEE